MTVAVIFRSRRTADHGEEYGAMSARMDELVREQPGFIEYFSVRDPASREGVTVALFVDDQAARSWKSHLEHVEAQRLGQERFYEEYRVIVTHVVRDYGGPRTGGPPPIQEA